MVLATLFLRELSLTFKTKLHNTLWEVVMPEYFVTGILRKYQENGHSGWVFTLCHGISDFRLGIKLKFMSMKTLDMNWRKMVSTLCQRVY